MVASIFCSAMISAAPRSRKPRGSLAFGLDCLGELMKTGICGLAGCTGPPVRRQGTARYPSKNIIDQKLTGAPLCRLRFGSVQCELAKYGASARPGVSEAVRTCDP